MPRSRSRSMESRTCSSISRAERTPVASKRRSASVDFPWSICAMIEKFRISSRRFSLMLFLALPCMVIPNYHTEKPRRFQARAVVLYYLKAKIFARRVKGARQILRRGTNIMQQIMTYAATLSKKGFDVRCFGTANEARRALLAAIPAGASVGIGGSMTIEQLGVESELKSRGCPVYWHWKSAPEQRAEVTKKAFCADFYLDEFQRRLAGRKPLEHRRKRQPSGHDAARDGKAHLRDRLQYNSPIPTPSNASSAKPAPKTPCVFT